MDLISVGGWLGRLSLRPARKSATLHALEMFFWGHMQRREFITLIGAAAAWPLVANAQQPIPVIGFLNVASPEGYTPYVAAFRDGLKESGYSDGQNVTIEFHWAEGHYERLPEMAANLVQRDVSVIVANTPANLAAKKATEAIPIVFTTASDPVAIGLVPNLSHPGGNVTGVSQINEALGPKRLELAHQLVPSASVIGLLVNPSDTGRSERLIQEVQAAAVHLGLNLKILRAGTEAEIEVAFADFAQLKAGPLVIGADAFYNAKSGLLAELSLRYSVPAIYEYTEFTNAGGLMSYGGNIKESYRWAGIYTGRILKGAKPADLPVQQSTTVELIVNLRTAKALGVTVPQSLLGRADVVIE
jgi:putative tryptophan/tyrosine transport system substrate-binding protein